MKMLPLANYRVAGDPVLLGPHGAISAAAFFAQAIKLAAALPATRFAINLCESRAAFMLGFAAALLRGQTSLLPAGQGRADWERLLTQYPGAYLLSDSGAVIDAMLAPMAAPPLHLDVAGWMAFGSAGEGALEMPVIPEAAIAAILFTSGSTGQPSAHPKTWGQLNRGAAALAAALGWHDVPACAIVGSVPPQHMFGLEATVMLPWYVGIPVHLQRPMLAADLVTALGQHALPSWWMTTAVHMRAPLGATAGLAGLCGVLASTMSVPKPLAVAAETAWQVPVMEIYGSTETGALALRRTASDTAWTPLPGVTVCNAAAATTAAAAIDGYANTSSWARGAHIEGAVQLGDALELMADGRFLLGERVHDLVKVGGKRASLAALHRSLCAVPGIDDACYFFADAPATSEGAAANDEVSAIQRPVAFYVSPSLLPQQVVSALRMSIDAVFIPRPLYRVAQLPRNGNGKLTREALMAMLAQCKAAYAPLATAAMRSALGGGIGAGAQASRIAADHPALPGHFPGAPLVPGVIILARVAESIRARFPRFELGTLLNARFHLPLAPEQPFLVHAEMHGGRVRFEVRNAADIMAGADGKAAAVAPLIASGQWACRPLRAAMGDMP